MRQASVHSVRRRKSWHFTRIPLWIISSTRATSAAVSYTHLAKRGILLTNLIEGESLLLLLDAKGISASSGSACTSGSLDPSHVLLAIGRVHDVAHGSLRLSLCEWNTEEEIDHILAAVPEVVERLRDMSPVWKDLLCGKRQFIL